MPTHLLSQSILRRCFEIMSMSLYKKRCTQTYEDAIEIGALQKNNEVQVESYRTRTRGALQARLEVGLEVDRFRGRNNFNHYSLSSLNFVSSPLNPGNTSTFNPSSNSLSIKPRPQSCASIRPASDDFRGLGGYTIQTTQGSW